MLESKVLIIAHSTLRICSSTYLVGGQGLSLERDARKHWLKGMPLSVQQRHVRNWNEIERCVRCDIRVTPLRHIEVARGFPEHVACAVHAQDLQRRCVSNQEAGRAQCCATGFAG
eukprot:gnl/TRDRNA2_/TRDRNA2_173600_c7_seq2.p1 gnl/TRDRNA2_/TRDRNA2_173600_c7~~gnl/TRDRNA2_/TRDRNA2_173600_c7_seq2.p1  ORF type:complete len:115 (-),score=10.61 gnl/TRDRNA2_/TRDRNA2_173600_c7_seq2:93-437(-)